MRLRDPVVPGLLFVLLLVACDRNEPTAVPKVVARAVTMDRVELRSIAGTDSASGLLVPREEAAVAPEQTGFRIAEVFVEEGAMVRTGQPLARLDDALLRARVAEARATAQQAQGEANRVKGLDGSGVLSDEEIAKRRSQATIAEAQLNNQLTQADRMLIRAPVSGLVLERNAEPGAVSGSADPMFRIARDGLIELDAEIPEDTLSRIELGSPATVTLPGGKQLAGEVRLISPRVDPMSKLGRVRIRLPIDPGLRAGGFAHVSLQRQAMAVLSVPEKALQFEASGPFLTVIGANNLATRMTVRTGARLEGYVELLAGPPAGTRVALGGGAFLLEGDPVLPVAPTPAGPVSSVAASTERN